MYHVSVYPYPHNPIFCKFLSKSAAFLASFLGATQGTADSDTPAYLLYDKPHPLFYFRRWCSLRRIEDRPSCTLLTHPTMFTESDPAFGCYEVGMYPREAFETDHVWRCRASDGKRGREMGEKTIRVEVGMKENVGAST